MPIAQARRAAAAALLLWAAGAETHAPAVAANAPAPRPSASQLNQTKESLTKLPNASDLRPLGAVSVTAKRADMIQGSFAIYSGNVVMDSDTLKLDGDRLELKQFPNSQYQATLTGGPAHMAHPSRGADDPPMTARAKTITYDSRSGIAELSGEAFVTKGEQNISADTIKYNVRENGIMASGLGEEGRVHIVIPPAAQPEAPAPNASPNPQLPATAEPPAAGAPANPPP